MLQNDNILDYKNFYLFYANLYDRLFNLINHIIDENTFNITKTKDKVNDFLDSYSYYLIKKKLIKKDEIDLTKEQLLNNLKTFDDFTKTIHKYPSEEFKLIRFELQQYNNDLKSLNKDKYNKLLIEYYNFFNDLIIIIKEFVDLSKTSGFLPNIKSKVALRSIGYANYDTFFKELENLKIKMSEVTQNIKLNNIFKSRRCVYTVLVVFSPYFNNIDLYNDLVKKLEFEFIEDPEMLENLKKSLDYGSLINMSKEMQNKINNNILKPLNRNISIIKRFISYEFGEKDLSPKIKKKYAFDPTGV